MRTQNNPDQLEFALDNQEALLVKHPPEVAVLLSVRGALNSTMMDDGYD